MPSELIIKINGLKLQFFDNVTLSTSIDAISSSFSFDSFIDLPDYEFSKIEVLRDNVIIFTGKVFSRVEPFTTNIKPIKYTAYSTTGELEDNTLPLTAYPIQTKNKNLKEIIDKICSNYGVIVKYDSSAQSDINKKYSLQDQNPSQKAAQIINTLCSQRNLIVTHNAKGELLITKNLVGSNANPPFEIKLSKNYNYRKFFNKYLVVGQKKIGKTTKRQAKSTFPEIPEIRNTTKIQTDGDAGTTQEQADTMKFDSYKSNSIPVDFHDHFAPTGEVYKIGSAKMICNSMNWNYRAGSETCSIQLLNLKVYQR